MTQIRGIKQGLSNISVDIEETTDYSSYFNVFGWKEEYNKGFHTLTISGSEELQRGTYIRIELLDEGGRPIPINLPSSNNSYEERYLPSRRIGFEITEETLNGVATMTFIGRTDDNEVVRYKKSFAINKNVQTNPLVERGVWEDGLYYEANNVVQYQGSSYVCILRHQASSSITPLNDTYWRIFAEGGTSTSIGLTRTPIIIPFDNDGVGLYGSNSSTRIFIREGTTDVSNEWSISASLVAGGDAQFSLVDDLLTITDITEDTESEILITASKDGDTLELQLSVLTVSSVAGTDAKLVKLNTDGQIFRYDGDGNPSPQTQEINFEVIRQNFDVSENTTWTITDENGDIVSNTILTNLDDYDATLSIANFAPYEKLTVKVSVGSGANEISDRVSIYRLKEGSEGITAILTNESHVVQTDSNGDNGDYSGAETDVWVFIGNDRIDLNANVTFEFRPQNTDVVIDNALSDTGNGYLKIQNLNVNLGYVDIDILIDDIKVLEKRFSISKSIAGEKGVDAKLVKLNADGQIFTYDANNNPTPTSQEITFDVIRQNILGSVNTTWTIVDGSGASVSNTVLTNITNDGATLTVANFGSYEKLTITATVDGISDRISVYKLNEGSEGVTVLLTNESHVLQADALGNVSDYSGASTNIWVYIGTQRIDQNANVTFTYTPQNTDVVIDNILSDTDDGFLKISELNSNSGYVDIDILIDSVKVFEKRFSLIKSIAGDDGIDGSDGVNARSVDLSTNKQVFIYDSNGDVKDNSSTTVVANAYNTDGTVYYEFVVNGTSVQNTTSNTYSYTPQALYTNMPQVISVNVREGSNSSTVVALDQLTLYGVKEGSDSLYVVLSNEAHTVGVDEFGGINYGGSGTDISVYEGSTKLLYDGSVPYGSPSFRIEILNENGIEANSNPSTINGNVRQYGDAQNMTSGQASITFNIIVTTSTGSEISIERTQSFTQSTAGTDGDDAQLLKIIADSQIFELDSEGNPINSTIVLEAFRQNYVTNDLEWYIDGEVTPSYTATDSVTISLSDFTSGQKQMKIRLQNVDNTLFDEISLFIIKDGTQAITINIPNDNHTFPASSDGSVLSYDGSSSIIEVYYGSTLLTYNNTATTFGNLSDLEWFIDDITVLPTSSITSTVAVSGNNASLSLSDFGDSYDNSIVSLTIGVKNGTDERTFQKTLSYSKSKAGINAKLISIEYDSQIFREDNIGQITPSSITLTANLQNISSNVEWRNRDTNTVISTNTSGSDNQILEVFPSLFGTENTLTIQAEADGFVALTTLAIVQNGADGEDGADGDDPYLALLSKYSHVVPTQSNGSAIAGVSYTNAISTLTIYKGGVDVTNTFSISVGGDTSLAPSDYSLVGDTVTISNMATDTEIFVFSATKAGEPTIVQTLALSKSRRGQDGGEATGIILIFRGIYDSNDNYQRTATYADVVRYNSSYWVVAEGTSNTSVEPTGLASEWNEIPSYQNLATDLLLAQDVTIRRSLTMGEQGDFGNIAGGIIRSLGGFDSSGNETVNQSLINRRYYELTKDGLFAHKGEIGDFLIDDNKIRSSNNSIILNSDGSGELANGDITWGVSGNATFSGSVTVTGGQLQTDLQSINTSLGNLSDGITDAKNDISVQLGFTDYNALVAQAITNGETLISGGFINTDLIQASTAFVNSLLAVDANITSKLTIGNDGGSNVVIDPTASAGDIGAVAPLDDYQFNNILSTTSSEWIVSETYTIINNNKPYQLDLTFNNTNNHLVVATVRLEGKESNTSYYTLNEKSFELNANSISSGKFIGNTGSVETIRVSVIFTSFQAPSAGVTVTPIFNQYEGSLLINNESIYIRISGDTVIPIDGFNSSGGSSGGGGTSINLLFWNDIQNKPFQSIGGNLNVNGSNVLDLAGDISITSLTSSRIVYDSTLTGGVERKYFRFGGGTDNTWYKVATLKQSSVGSYDAVNGEIELWDFQGNHGQQIPLKHKAYFRFYAYSGAETLVDDIDLEVTDGMPNSIRIVKNGVNDYELQVRQYSNYKTLYAIVTFFHNTTNDSSIEDDLVAPSSSTDVVSTTGRYKSNLGDVNQNTLSIGGSTVIDINKNFNGQNAEFTGTLDVTGNATFDSNVILGNQASATNHAVRADRSISSGNGLTGGGNLTANRTITLGTPSTITVGGSNGVTASSHSHTLNLSGRTITINNDGDSILTWDSNAQNLGGNRTWTPTIANHGNGQRGVVSTGTQTFFGAKTLNDDTVFNGKVSSTGAISGQQGWQGTQSGDWDFQSITAKSLIVKAFTADVAQAFRGSRFLTKSFATIAEDFTVPAVNSGATMTVNSIDGYANLDVFGVGDFILLTIVSQSDGGLIVGEAWGEVSSLTTDASAKTQSFTFTTRNVSDNVIVGLSANEGSEALSFGSEADPKGFIHDTVLDNIGSPYSEIVTWTYNTQDSTGPWDRSNWELKTRLGNLAGLPNLSDDTTPNGFGLYGQNVFLEGTIVADSGKIAGWSLTNTQFTSSNSNIILNSSGDGIIEVGSGASPDYWNGDGTFRFGGTNGISWAGGTNNVIIGTGTTIKGDLDAVGGTFTGTLDAVDGNFSGTITATLGTIAGWGISTNALQNISGTESGSGIYFNSEDPIIFVGDGISNVKSPNIGVFSGFWSGKHSGVYKTYIGKTINSALGEWIRIDSNGIRINTDNFNIADNGDVTISGDVTATEGTIGGWTISTTAITKGNISLDSSGTGSIKVGTSDFWDGDTSFNFGGADGISYSGSGNVVIGSGTVIQGTLQATDGLIGNWTINDNAICQNYKNGSYFTLSSSRLDRSSTIGLSLYNQDSKEVDGLNVTIGADELRLIRIGEISDQDTTYNFSTESYGIQIGYGTFQDYEDRFRVDDNGIILKPNIFVLDTGGGFESADLFIDSETGEFSVSTIFSVDLPNSSGRIGNWYFDTTTIRSGFSSGSLGIQNGNKDLSIRYRDGIFSTGSVENYGYYVDEFNYFINRNGINYFSVAKSATNYLGYDTSTGVLETTGSIELKGDGVITTVDGDYALSSSGLEIAPRESFLSTTKDRSINFQNQADATQVRFTLVDDTTNSQNYFFLLTSVDFRLNLSNSANFIISNLPTSSPSASSGRLYTRTKSQLDAQPSTKVLCVS